MLLQTTDYTFIWIDLLISCRRKYLSAEDNILNSSFKTFGKVQNDMHGQNLIFDIYISQS